MIVLKADKTDDSPEVDQLLLELGHASRGIPYYALMRPDSGPVHFEGVYFSPSQFLNQLGAINIPAPTKVESLVDFEEAPDLPPEDEVRFSQLPPPPQ